MKDSSEDDSRTKFLGLRVYYGWWIVAGGVVLSAIQGGFIFYGFSAFFLPLAQEFQTGRGTIALVVGLGSVMQSGAVAPAAGYLIDRVGSRRITLIGVGLLGLGFILISQAPNLVAFFIFYLFFVTLGAGLGTIQPIYAAVAKWFVRRRGVAAAITSSGVGVGALFVTITTILIETFGWRSAAATIGLAIWGIGLPLATLMRSRPEDYGMLPDGLIPDAKRETSESSHNLAEIDFTMRQAISTRAFWQIGFAMMLRTGVWVGVTTHFIPAMVDKGLSATTAAALIGYIGFVSIPGRIFAGILGDKFSHTMMHSLGAGFMGFGVLVLVWSGVQLWQILIFLTLYGAGGGGAAALMWSVTGSFFGRRSFATIMGSISAIMVLATATFPVLAGYLFDRTGSYDMALYIFAIAAFASTALMFTATKPIRPVNSGNNR